MSDPAALLGGGLRQPDARSCGASALVAARMLVDADYAAAMTPGGFARDALATHRRVTRVSGPGLQLPWPRALGTPPWAVARELSRLASPGSPATRYASRLALLRPAAAFDRARTAVRSGRAAALYVGSRWCPRHVVLALPAAPAVPHLRVYEPSTGRVVEVTRDAAAGHRLALAGWDRLWLVVTPSGG
ncbi:hypothetical protein [Nocardioides sp. cx-173]|uniref:hypothetical protein n=1 Tax=Nocardioides sp. cx-173 TaxID=2898796 RepID=UPI001E415F5B|nr:hypothetical protein [Nocardioides sp. cx-173]MCD4524548.1 hypothetical protein [Nocardioides sp. cx-173]UGB42967.1 hypothetical protein LQ940_05445 [Nocardioides sp. cx-173]